MGLYYFHYRFSIDLIRCKMFRKLQNIMFSFYNDIDIILYVLTEGQYPHFIFIHDLTIYKSILKEKCKKTKSYKDLKYTMVSNDVSIICQ